MSSICLIHCLIHSVSSFALLQSKMQPSFSVPWLNNNASQSSGTFFRTNLIMFACLVQLNGSLHTWILDFRATHHITPYIQLVHNPMTLNSELHLANGEKSVLTHIKDIHLSTKIHFVVPLFHYNLLSIL